MAIELPQLKQLSELPLAQPAERADAARNRERVLCAARNLVAERGPGGFSMHDVAKSAGVGPGTVYRRFTDLTGLIYALLDETERRFQDELLSGPPPLGPGAEASDRLRAFGRRYVVHLEEVGPLLCHAGATAPLLGGPFPSYRALLSGLLAEAAPGVDAEFATESLLSAASPMVHRHQRQDLGWSIERIQDGWVALVDGWVGPG